MDGIDEITIPAEEILTVYHRARQTRSEIEASLMMARIQIEDKEDMFKRALEHEANCLAALELARAAGGPDKKTLTINLSSGRQDKATSAQGGHPHAPPPRLLTLREAARGHTFCLKRS